MLPLPGESGPGSDGNEWMLHIPQSPGITENSAGAVEYIDCTSAEG